MDRAGWTKRAREIKARDGGRCRKCRATVRLTVHHIKPRDEGGSDEPRNLITLCESCHDWAELRIAEGELPMEELVRRPREDRGERRIWYQDRDGRICAYVT